MKYIYLLFTLIAFNASASLPGKLYFSDRNMDEYEVQFTGSSYTPKTLNIIKVCSSINCQIEDSYSLVYDLVGAMQRGIVYTYKFESHPCDDPFGCDSPRSVTRKTDLKKEYLNAFGAGLVTGIAEQTGSNSISSLTNEIVSNNGINGKPLVMVTKNEAGKPLYACKIDDLSSCTIVEEVIFTNHSNGEIQVSMTVDPYSSETANLMQNSLENFMRNISNDTWRCISVGTGPSGDIRWSMLCGYWP
ncbi:hypothetical protein [Shewanella sp. NIFS-20-20]|uniref:hypothetical protein n=1 Tax=Shewanella sp. NIFS-20-20 TaxID=2853806 RepID=UPI001C491D2B|nr:hypothetical protein [Shewanella sp. NIFS-20-20]MBV7317636.1 hypothetical protein [Shewanella sp. NIFS-20-20]